MDKKYGNWEVVKFCPECNEETNFRKIYENDDTCPLCGFKKDYLSIDLVEKVRRKVYTYKIEEKEFLFFFKTKVKKTEFEWEYKEDESK